MNALPRVAAMLAFALVSCGGNTAPSKGSYTLRLFDFPDIERGQPLHLKLKPKDGDATLATYDGSINPQGEQTIVLDKVLEAGKEYRVDYYVDLDRNNEYTRPTGTMFRDPSWRRFVTGEATPVSDSHAHDDRFIDISPF